MNLISCDNCAVVLDGSKLNFSDENHFYDETGELIEERAVWSSDHNTHVAKVPCPICNEDILER